MNTFRKKISALSVPEAIIITGILISISIFFTVYLFFGGINNRNKLFSKNPVPINNRNIVQNNQLQNPMLVTGSQNILKVASSTTSALQNALKVPTSTSNTIKKTGVSKTK